MCQIHTMLKLSRVSRFPPEPDLIVVEGEMGTSGFVVSWSKSGTTNQVEFQVALHFSRII